MSNSLDVQKAASTRRMFVRGTNAAMAVAAVRPTEALALDGGTPAVTVPAGRQSEISRWPRFGDAEKKAVVEMLDSSKFYQEIPAFESELKDYLKSPYVKAHMNCTSALMSMFFALDFPRGSEIMAPSYTAWATTAPMHLFGLVPVFVDLNPKTMTFDVDYARKHLNPRVKALLPMHSFGNPCDMDQICAFAKEKGLVVVEDAAQAQGAYLQDKPLGTWGSIGCFSFQTSKVLPAIEGGAAVYQTRDYYERATMFGNYELPASFPADSPYRGYQGTGMGPKFRIHPFAAALARRQLRGMDQRNEFVDRQVRSLTARLTHLPGVSVPYCRPDAKRVYWGSHMLFLDEAKAGCPKEALLNALRAEGVRVGPGAYDEQHKYKLYSEAKWWHHPPQIPKELPGTAQVNRTAVRMPLFYEEASELIEQYVKAFEKVWAKRSQLAKS